MTLIIHDPPTISKPVSAKAVRDLLRSRVGDEITVNRGKTGIFLYAATADAAGTSERRAQEVLDQQGLVADIRLERWDLSRRAWIDVRSELPSGHEPNPGRRRMRSAAAALVAVMIEAIGNAWPQH